MHAGEIANARLVLALPAGEIRGVVRDQRGAPVTDAFVTAAVELDPSSPAIASRAGGSQVLTSGDGSFVVTRLDPATYTVRAYRKGGAEALALHVAVGSRVTLELAATGSITGVVRQRGVALDDVRIVLEDPVHLDVIRREALVHTGGSFTLREVPAGHYVITAASGDARASRELDVRSGECATIELALDPVVTLVGRAVNLRTGAPVPGYVIFTMAADALGFPSWSLNPVDEISDEAGHFRLSGVPRGRITIYCAPAGQIGSDRLRLVASLTIAATAGEVVDLGDLGITDPSSDAGGDSGLSVQVTDRSPDTPSPRSPASRRGDRPRGPAWSTVTPSPRSTASTCPARTRTRPPGWSPASPGDRSGSRSRAAGPGPSCSRRRTRTRTATASSVRRTARSAACRRGGGVRGDRGDHGRGDRAWACPSSGRACPWRPAGWSAGRS